jgi:hypothetical protein
MSRFVTVPAHIVAVHPLSKKPIVSYDVNKDGTVKSETDDDPWTIYRFLVMLVFVRPEWLKPLKRSRMANRIMNKFEDVEPGVVVELKDDQWRDLRDTLEEADFELPKHFGNQLTDFADAIIDAPEKATLPEAKVVDADDAAKAKAKADDKAEEKLDEVGLSD